MTWTKLKKLHLSLKFINSSDIWWSIKNLKKTPDFLSTKSQVWFNTDNSKIFPLFTEIWPLSLRSHFPMPESRNDENLTIFHNFKSRMRQQSYNKCVEVTHWLKKHVCILRQFSIFPGDKIFAHGRKFTPVLFEEWYEYFLVQIKCSDCWKIISSYFWCSKPISSFVLLCSCKEKNNWNELCIQYRTVGTSHPTSEIATSHV